MKGLLICGVQERPSGGRTFISGRSASGGPVQYEVSGCARHPTIQILQNVVFLIQFLRTGMYAESKTHKKLSEVGIVMHLHIYFRNAYFSTHITEWSLESLTIKMDIRIFIPFFKPPAYAEQVRVQLVDGVTSSTNSVEIRGASLHKLAATYCRPLKILHSTNTLTRCPYSVSRY